MEGRATAPGAGTVLNALANGSGSAFAIDARTTATVELDDSGTVTGEVAGAPDAAGQPRHEYLLAGAVHVIDASDCLGRVCHTR